MLINRAKLPFPWHVWYS